MNIKINLYLILVLSSLSINGMHSSSKPSAVGYSHVKLVRNCEGEFVLVSACVSCGTTLLGVILKCGGSCKGQARYCDKKCQRADWARHKSYDSCEKIKK